MTFPHTDLEVSYLSLSLGSPLVSTCVPSMAILFISPYIFRIWNMEVLSSLRNLRLQPHHPLLRLLHPLHRLDALFVLPLVSRAVEHVCLVGNHRTEAVSCKKIKGNDELVRTIIEYLLHLHGLILLDDNR